MNVLVIVISVLVSVICVLLALLQHYYFVYKLYKKPSIKYDVPVFEDLIPTDENNNHALGYLRHDYDSSQDVILSNLNAMLESRPKIDEINFKRKDIKTLSTQNEVFNSLQAAIAFKLCGKTHKAIKLFEHAAAIAPQNADVLNHYGEFLEQFQEDVVTADELYSRALAYSPNHPAALMNRKRTAQVVDKLDYEMFKNIDEKNAFLKDNFNKNNHEAVKKQAYYLHIYHTVGIEGNTMTVEQLRTLLETGQVIPGKSLIEHNEVIGLQLAMKYVKILTRLDYIGVREILGIHRRVMGHVNPLSCGVYRLEKVFIGSHVPPPPEEVPELMENYVLWLNSEEAQSMHPVRYAALAHYKLVDIHPFVDGNGRTSRLIMNLILLRGGYPPVMILKEQRNKYYDALNTANLGDVRPFVRFIAQCTLQILDMYIYGTQLLSIEDLENNSLHPKY